MLGASLDFGVPYGLLAVIIIVVPACFAVFLGTFAFRRLTPSVFRCQKCDRLFRGAAHRGFPQACEHCGSRDWNGAPTG